MAIAISITTNPSPIWCHRTIIESPATSKTSDRSSLTRFSDSHSSIATYFESEADRVHRGSLTTTPLGEARFSSDTAPRPAVDGEEDPAARAGPVAQEYSAPSYSILNCPLAPGRGQIA